LYLTKEKNSQGCYYHLVGLFAMKIILKGEEIFDVEEYFAGILQ